MPAKEFPRRLYNTISFVYSTLFVSISIHCCLSRVALTTLESAGCFIIVVICWSVRCISLWAVRHCRVFSAWCLFRGQEYLWILKGYVLKRCQCWHTLKLLKNVRLQGFFVVFCNFFSQNGFDENNDDIGNTLATFYRYIISFEDVSVGTTKSWFTKTVTTVTQTSRMWKSEGDKSSSARKTVKTESHVQTVAETTDLSEVDAQ